MEYFFFWWHFTFYSLNVCTNICTFDFLLWKDMLVVTFVAERCTLRMNEFTYWYFRCCLTWNYLQYAVVYFYKKWKIFHRNIVLIYLRVVFFFFLFFPLLLFAQKMNSFPTSANCTIKFTIVQSKSKIMVPSNQRVWAEKVCNSDGSIHSTIRLLPIQKPISRPQW